VGTTPVLTDHVIETPVKRAKSQLTIAFNALHLWDKAAILAAIRTVDKLPTLHTIKAVNAVAFKNSALHGGGPSQLPGGDKSYLKIAAELRDTLKVLARTGRLPATGAAFQLLATTFNTEADPGWSVGRGDDGRVQIIMQLRFKSALGLIAYAAVRLSEMSAQSPALLVCDECEQFKFIESTGGSRISRFCSTKCRNRYTVREFRRSNRTARKPK
jgi:hypothetical protein